MRLQSHRVRAGVWRPGARAGRRRGVGARITSIEKVQIVPAPTGRSALEQIHFCKKKQGFKWLVWSLLLHPPQPGQSRQATPVSNQSASEIVASKDNPIPNTSEFVDLPLQVDDLRGAGWGCRSSPSVYRVS